MCGCVGEGARLELLSWIERECVISLTGVNS
jgi:hypothetical protein